MSMERVHCPHCGRRFSPVIVGSECHCACGAVLRITGKSEYHLQIEVLKPEQNRRWTTQGQNTKVGP